MLSKNNKILIGCLALLLVMSVGYALFSDTITINGSATAKGEFNIIPTCEVITSGNATEDEANYTTKGGTGVCEVNDKTVTTTSNLTKPGDMIFYRVTIKNDGTIPAVLKSVSSPNNAENVSFTGNVPSGDKMYVDKDYYLLAYYGILSNGEFVGIGDSEVPYANVTLQPGEKRDFYILHAWGDVNFKEQPELPEDGVSFSYDLTLGFEQITD